MVASVAVMVIPAFLKSGAESAVPSVYPDCVGEMFSVPLSSDGQEPVTHWAALPVVSEAVMQGIQYMASQEPFASNAHLDSCEPLESAATFRGMIANLGLQRIEVAE